MSNDDKQALAEQAYQKALQYELSYGCCPQCVLATVQETVGVVDDQTIKASHGLSGGGGLVGQGTCGALTGGLMAISANSAATAASSIPDATSTISKRAASSSSVSDRSSAASPARRCSGNSPGAPTTCGTPRSTRPSMPPAAGSARMRPAWSPGGWLRSCGVLNVVEQADFRLRLSGVKPCASHGLLAVGENPRHKAIP